MHYIYILKSVNNPKKLYIGFTNDLRRRFTEHNKGQSQYTKKYLPWKIIYYEAYSSEKDAKGRERKLKQHARAWAQIKRRIVNSINES